MAARPLVSDPTARMISPCHNTMLNMASQNSSPHWWRGTAKGTLSRRSVSANSGNPKVVAIARKVKGGKSRTPIFMMGQLMPHTRVKIASTTHCRCESLCMSELS